MPDEFFDLWKRLTPGTSLTDMDVRVTWTVGGRDLEALAEDVGPVMEDLPIPVPERTAADRGSLPSATKGASAPAGPARGSSPSGISATGTSSWKWWLAGIVLAAGIAALSVAIVRRRREGHAPGAPR